MTVAPVVPEVKPRRLSASPDVQLIFWLAGALMLAACVLPWALLRPNRLASGVYMNLPAVWVGVCAVLALALPLSARFLVRMAPLLSGLALALGFYLLGARMSAAMLDQSDIARASASSGVWVWLLGAGTAVYGAGQIRVPGRLWAWLSWLWLPVLIVLALTGQLAAWSVLRELDAQQARFLQEVGQHLKLVLTGLGLAVLIGAPLAVWASRRPRAADAVLGFANGVQTIPSLALLGLLIAPLGALATALPFLRQVGVSGIGTAPALTALTLYALLPVLRNGLVALRGVSPGALDAARGMGMTDNQRFWRVQLPLALPVWLSGIRQAAVLLVGVASIAQLIGAGGLGYFIFSGLQTAASDLILLGAIPAALLAIGVDALLRGLEVLLARQWGRG
ncbi:ABC transporter permease [Deinococcus humi]|uniref:Osmoprotectant transport system permease protein n=1 Tax=Deinococcus humi TaxID=662880 RepID=A0A7W8JWS2_9DEIO|nr:ABC transporter permease [Deinococcus humi]MBB5364671.1 osmoprotectant transport system permease protein [Deinococcus humi]GGO34199.1 osmoprotectant uptake system permease [Deinococcus humi]